MVRIPEETINQIRSQADIVDVIGQYLDLNKSGANYFAHCPFHEDSTPSFSVNRDKQIYKCFSCKRGGSVFSFIQEKEGLSFPESVLKVAELANVDLDPALIEAVQGQPAQADSPYRDLYTIHDQAKDFYQYILLKAQVGEVAYDYLQSRGISREVMEEFDLGYSPSQRESLHLYLQTQDQVDLTDDLLEETGLFSKREAESASFKDRFAKRIVFPLKNLQGQTVGFSGRYFQDEPNQDFHQAKYLNSPETKIFNKRRTLFNYDKAKAHIRRAKEVVLFEGYMDVIAAWQAGVKNGLASMGTSLTADQVQTMQRIADTLVLAFDGDEAGLESSKKILDDLSLTSKLQIEVVIFPKKLDPDEYIRENGPEAFQNLIQHGRMTVYQFLKEYFKKSYNLDNESDRLKFIQTMTNEIGKLSSPLEREVYAKDLAEEFNLSYDTIISQVQSEATLNRQEALKEDRHKEFSQARVEVKAPSSQKTKIDRAQEKLLNRLFYYPHVQEIIDAYNPDFEFKTEVHQRIYLLFLAYSQENDGIDSFIDFVKDKETKEVISDIMWTSIEVEPSDEEILDYLNYIDQIYPLEQKRQDRLEEVKAAKQSGNKKRELELTNELIEINRRLKQ